MRKFITMLILLSVSIALTAAETPDQVMRKVVEKIRTAKGVAGRYTASTSRGASSGSFRFDGRRFHMDMPGYGRIWYDGRSLYSVNDNTREVTVSTPSGEELRDANPLLYLSGYDKSNRLFFSKRREKGKYLVLLNPKSHNADYKAIEIRVNTSTYEPERIVVRDRKDQTTTVSLGGLSYTRKFMDSDFTFPASRYADYEIVDLR